MAASVDVCEEIEGAGISGFHWSNVVAIRVFQLGFSLGGIMAGFAGAFLGTTFGWQAIYYAGSASILVAVAAQCLLPASAQYLTARCDFDGIGRVLGRLRPARKHLYEGAVSTTAVNMASPLHKLFPHEFEELLNALRRDLRVEQELAARDSAWADWHRVNARTVNRLLEVLNPKSFVA